MAEQEIAQVTIGHNRREADLLVLCDKPLAVFADRRRTPATPPYAVVIEFMPNIKVRITNSAEFLIAVRRAAFGD